jgi:23S rRNA pseudouridine2605 synthase
MKSHKDNFSSDKSKGKPKSTVKKDSPFKQYFKPSFEKNDGDDRSRSRSSGEDRRSSSDGDRFSSKGAARPASSERYSKFDSDGSSNPFSKSRKSPDQDRPFERRSSGGESRPFGDRREERQDRPFERRSSGGESRPFSDRREERQDRPFERRSSGGESRPFGDRREERQDRPFERRSSGGESRPFSDRREERQDRPFERISSGGESRPFGDRREERQDRPFERRSDSRDFKPFDGMKSSKEASKSFSGDRRDGDNSFGDHKKNEDRPAFSPKKKLFEDDFFSKPKPSFDREERFSKDRKPFDNKKSFGDKHDFLKREFDKERFASKDHFDGRRDDKPTYSNKDRFSQDDNFGEKKFDERDSGPLRSRYEDGGRFNDKPYKSKYNDDKSSKKSKGVIEEGSGILRLNKFVAQSGLCSRRKAVELIKDGEIYLNGVVEHNPAYEIKESDIITHKNIVLKKEEKMLYLLMNKPKNVITTAEDEKGRRTVLDLVKERYPERVYPVGRLDRNTLGLLLITNDGDLAKKLSHPSHQVKKFYQVELDRNIKPTDLEKIKEGLMLDDGLAEVDAVDYIEGGKKNEVGIEIHSGKNRIVRRIFEAVGYEVVKLDRTYYAGLTKKDLPRGFIRELNEKEIIMLKHFTNMRKKDEVIN